MMNKYYLKGIGRGSTRRMAEKYKIESRNGGQGEDTTYRVRVIGPVKRNYETEMIEVYASPTKTCNIKRELGNIENITCQGMSSATRMCNYSMCYDKGPQYIFQKAEDNTYH
jgi:hypothetical protein